jgi:hypothetical protein
MAHGDLLMGRVVTIAGCVLLGSCAPSSPRGEFTGRYEAGFERSAFTPCGSPETWWVVFDSTTNLDRQVFPRLTQLDGHPDSLLGDAVAFAVFRGDTSGVGSYGHLGQQNRRLDVTEVKALRRWAPGDCANTTTTALPQGAI